MREITDIPGDRVGQTVRDFENAGCTDVQRTRQEDGNWTVRANCDDA